MFINIFLFELHYLFRRPATYVYFAVLFLLSFLLITTDADSIVGSIGKVMKNSPFVIARTTILLTLIGTVITTALAGTAIIRDFQHNSHELFFTTPLTKLQYIGGRFLGALTAMFFAYSGILVGMLIGSYMPWLDADKIMPFHAMSYISPFFVFIVPNTLFLSALFFAVGTLSRKLLVVYIQGIVLLAAWGIAGDLTANLDNDLATSLLDPFGIRAFGIETRYWTVVEKNAFTVPLEGYLLYNRLLWLGLGAICVALTYVTFKFNVQGITLRKKRKSVSDTETEKAPIKIALPTPALQFDTSTYVKQLVSQIKFYFTHIVKSIPFLAIATIGCINFYFSALYADTIDGSAVYPVTYIMLQAIGTFNLFFVIISLFYAGELTWRERNLNADQLYDATPVAENQSLIGKIVALCMAQGALLLILMCAAMLIQAAKGYTNFEVGLYIRTLMGETFPYIIMITILSFLVHAIVNHKFIGHLVIVLYYVTSSVLPTLGFEHNLYQYASHPGYIYSDMNGFGHFVAPLLWFNFYWLAVGLVFTFITYLFWVRGVNSSWQEKLVIAKRRLTRPAVAYCSTTLLIAIAAGGYIFYNTNILNEYITSDDSNDEREKYETTYKKFEDTPQPRITDVFIEIDIHPETRKYNVKGRYKLVNKHPFALDSVHVNLDNDAIINALHFERSHERVLQDDELGYHIYTFAQPIEPFDTLTLTFDLLWEELGFVNQGSNTSIVENGTFINSGGFPSLGYIDGYEISDQEERNERELPLRDRMNALHDTAAHHNTYLTADSDWINFECIISTAPDQIAVAPGYLQREWEERGRRYFHYKMDAPILNFYSFLSARYEIARDKWNDVNIEVYYHKGHPYNVDRMIESIKKSLAYYTQYFGPYQHKQARILEFPRFGRFAQAFPNTIPYSERIGFIARMKDEFDIDHPFYVTAHEIAHQWWAHQVIGADVQGSTMMSETLCQYSALMIMEREYGIPFMKKFLRYELDRYLRGRSTERIKEQPLILVENQQYIHYSKGSLAMYTLKDLIGEDSLNAALARYIQQTAFQEPPYTTSPDLIRNLREVTPDSLQYLITDLFETITLYENRALNAAAEATEGGEYKVTLELSAIKLRADSLGMETPIAMNDWVDIGIFGAENPEAPSGTNLGKPLYFEKHRIKQGRSKIEIVVNEKPVKAGIDPYNKLIDRTPSDNVERVESD